MSTPDDPAVVVQERAALAAEWETVHRREQELDEREARIAATEQRTAELEAQAETKLLALLAVVKRQAG
jgi:hypothetical protein